MTTKIYYPTLYNLEDCLVEAEERQWLDKVLRQLPRLEQQILVLKYFHGLSREDIAQELGCPVGTVRNRAYRALKELRHLGEVSD